MFIILDASDTKHIQVVSFLDGTTRYFDSKEEAVVYAELNINFPIIVKVE